MAPDGAAVRSPPQHPDTPRRRAGRPGPKSPSPCSAATHSGLPRGSRRQVERRQLRHSCKGSQARGAEPHLPDVRRVGVPGDEAGSPASFGSCRTRFLLVSPPASGAARPVPRLCEDRDVPSYCRAQRNPAAAMVTVPRGHGSTSRHSGCGPLHPAASGHDRILEAARQRVHQQAEGSASQGSWVGPSRASCAATSRAWTAARTAQGPFASCSNPASRRRLRWRSSGSLPPRSRPPCSAAPPANRTLQLRQLGALQSGLLSCARSGWVRWSDTGAGAVPPAVHGRCAASPLPAHPLPLRLRSHVTRGQQSST